MSLDAVCLENARVILDNELLEYPNCDLIVSDDLVDIIKNITKGKIIMKLSEIPSSYYNPIFIVSSDRAAVNMLINQIKHMGLPKYIIYFVPRTSVVWEDVLRKYTTDELCIRSCNIDIIPTHEAILNMNFGKLNRFDRIFLSARALMQLQCSIGKIDNIKTIGDGSLTIANMIRKNFDIHCKDRGYKYIPKCSMYDAIIIFDRESDMISPLMKGITYGTFVENIKPDDKIFAECRYEKLEDIPKYLQCKAKQLSEFENKEKLSSMGLKDLRGVVSQISNHYKLKSDLKWHIDNFDRLLSETKKFVPSLFDEIYIYQNDPYKTFLLIIQHAQNTRMSKRQQNLYLKEFILRHGVDYLQLVMFALKYDLLVNSKRPRSMVDQIKLNLTPDIKNVIIVCIGGITNDEVAELKLIKSHNLNIITTHITNGVEQLKYFEQCPL